MAPKEKNKGRHNLSRGKTCPQCCQITTILAGACKMYRKKGRKDRRLFSRYGPYGKGEEEMLESWICPKCRGICNCSCCRKKKGEMPIGALVHVAKATGWTSVHDLLQKGPEAVAAAMILDNGA